MRILHFSDLHIGVENYGRTDPATGLSTRMGDFLAAFDELVDFAIESSVDLVLFAGDAYKSREPNQTQQREFAKRIGRLAGEGIKVFLLVGNHDLPNALARATAIEIFDTLAIDNVTVAGTAGTTRIETRSGPVQIVAIPWPRRSVLLARDTAKNLTFDEMNRRIEDILTAHVLKESQALDASIPSILTAHVSISEATLGSERSMMVGSDHVLLRSTVSQPTFDYVGLGHIHRMQVLNESPPVVYCGSLQRVDFGEEKDDKGFYVVDIDPSLPQGQRVTSYQFHQVKARRFVTIDIDVKPDDLDPTAVVLREVQRHSIADAIVRLRIKVPSELDAGIREAEIRRALSDAHFVASISREVERERTVRLGDQSVESMTPLDSLKAYVDSMSDSRGWSEQRKRELISEGEALISETTASPE